MLKWTEIINFTWLAHFCLGGLQEDRENHCWGVLMTKRLFSASVMLSLRNPLLGWRRFVLLMQMLVLVCIPTSTPWAHRRVLQGWRALLPFNNWMLNQEKKWFLLFWCCLGIAFFAFFFFNFMTLKCLEEKNLFQSQHFSFQLMAIESSQRMSHTAGFPVRTRKTRFKNLVVLLWF